MQIKFYGHSCFSITEGGVTLVTDPYGENSGKKLPDINANIATVSCNNHNHNNVSELQNSPKVFNWPGEYEAFDIHVNGISYYYNNENDEEQEENTIFKIVFKGIHICHLGSIGRKLSTKELEKISDVDVLFIPVGNQKLSTKQVKEIIEQIEPRIIIPMAYQSENFDNDLNPISGFLTEMGANNIEELDVFTVKRTELPDDASKIVLLKELS